MKSILIVPKVGWYEVGRTYIRDSSYKESTKVVEIPETEKIIIMAEFDLNISTSLECSASIEGAGVARVSVCYVFQEETKEAHNFCMISFNKIANSIIRNRAEI